MSAIHLEWNPVEQQLESLRVLVEELRREVGELRAENAELRREVGYWQSMHARAIERNTKQQSELEEAKAEIRQLKAERFGKKTEKQSASDRTNRLDDPNEKTARKRTAAPSGISVHQRLPAMVDLSLWRFFFPHESAVCGRRIWFGSTRRSL